MLAHRLQYKPSMCRVSTGYSLFYQILGVAFLAPLLILIKKGGLLQ